TRPPAIEGLPQFCVPPIDVGMAYHFTVCLRLAGDVTNAQVHWLQTYLSAQFFAHEPIEVARRAVGILLAYHVPGKFKCALNANASMTQGQVVCIEESFGVGVVKVDVVIVYKIELQQTQGVERSWSLPDQVREVIHAKRCPVDRIRMYSCSFDIENVIAVDIQVCGVVLYLWQ